MQNFKIFEDIDYTEMLKIPAGNFDMGGLEYDYEQPIHPVQIASFYMGKYLVTQALWEKVMGTNPSKFKGKNRPVERVSWNEITNDFLPKLNALVNQDGKYRLPSEAEWEYAAKVNNNYKYSGSDDLESVGWYYDNSHQETKPVGLKNPNDFGLYDMSGNVWEWCEDHWHSNYKNAPKDGSAWIDETADDSRLRVQRGGSYFNIASYCRTSFRDYNNPRSQGNGVGFRLVFQFNKNSGALQ